MSNITAWAKDQMGVCSPVALVGDGWRFTFVEANGAVTYGPLVPAARVFATEHECLSGVRKPASRTRRECGAGYRLGKMQPREGARKNPPPGQLRSALAPTSEVEAARLAAKDAAYARLQAAAASNAPVRHNVLVVGGNAALLADEERLVLRTTKSGKQMSAGVAVRLVLVQNGPGDWSLLESSIAGRQIPPYLVELERNGQTRLRIVVRLEDVGEDDLELMLADRTLKLVDSDEITSPENPVDLFADAVNDGDRVAAAKALQQMGEDKLAVLADENEISLGNITHAAKMRDRILAAFEEEFEDGPRRATAGGSVATTQAAVPVPQMPAHVAARLAAVMSAPVQQAPAVQPVQAAAPQYTGAPRPKGAPDVQVIISEVESVTRGSLMSGEMGVLSIGEAGGDVQAVLMLADGRLLETGRVTKSSTDNEELRLYFDPPQGDLAGATVNLIGRKTTRLNLPLH